MSDLVKHAQRELELAGLFSPDSDYDGMLGTACLELVRTFSMQGHSGYSAEMVTQLITKLFRYENLTPLTYAEDEWVEITEPVGMGIWQNKRDIRVFSGDNGKTHYTFEERGADDAYA